MTPTVMTVLGPVAAADLGVVLPHEHLLVRLWSQPDQHADPRFHERLTLANLGWVRQNWSANADNVHLGSESARDPRARSVQGGRRRERWST